MRLPLLAASLLGVPALSSVAPGQVTPRDLPPIVTPEDQTDLAGVVRAMLAPFRSGPAACEVVVRAFAADGRERVSRVEVRTDPGDPASERPARVVLRLGRSLHVDASEGVLRAISPRNPESAFEGPIPHPLTPAAIETLLPAVPLPHVAWALGAPGRVEGVPVVLDVPPLGEVTLDRLARDPLRAEITLHGRNAGGVVEIGVDAESGHFRRLLGMVHATGVAIEVASREVSPDGRWGVETAGRRLVASLADLRPAPAEIPVGAKAVGLGLMGPDLTPWSVVDALHAVGQDPLEAGRGPVLAALVLYRADDPAMEDGALAAVSALRGLKRLLDRARLAGEDRTPRLIVRPVGVFELDKFRPAEVRMLTERWEGVGVGVSWSSAGRALLDRFERGAGGVVILVDDEQTLRGVTSFAPGALAADAAVDEVRSAIRDLSPTR